MELHLHNLPVGDRLTVLHCGSEAHLVSGPNGFFIQAVRKASNNSDVPDETIGADQHSGHYGSLCAVSASELGVVQAWSIESDGVSVDHGLAGGAAIRQDR